VGDALTALVGPDLQATARPQVDGR
jgi:hypothetical protein